MTPRHFCVAGVALGDIYLRFAWHAGVALVALGWLCWRAWTGLVAGDAAAFCVAGVALGDIYFGFAWQAWHLVTIYFGFAWQACHLRHWAGSGGALGPDYSPVTPRHFAWQAWHLATSTLVLRGRRGTWRHTQTLQKALNKESP